MNKTKRDTIICDLDGTLADCSHRRHFVEQKPKDWVSFYAGCINDRFNEPVAALLFAMATSIGVADTRLVFCTGRPERCRADTLSWLSQRDTEMHWGFELYMRRDGDYRADHIVKQEILDKYIDKERVLFVLDDRQQVVDMWRRNGLTCFQVAPGDF